MLYQSPVRRYGLLLLTVPALLWRLRRDRLDPLAWTALILAPCVAAGALVDRWSLARLLPGVAICGQLALAVLLTEGWGSWQAVRRAVRAGIAVLTAVTVLSVATGAWGQRGAVARALPGAERRAHYERITHAQLPYPDVSFVRGLVREGDVAIANEWRAARQLPTYGLYTVSPQWPSPGLADASQRAAAAKAIFDPATPQPERDRLLATWKVRWIVWLPTGDGPRWPYPGARVTGCGPNRAALLLVDPAAGTPSACPP